MPGAHGNSQTPGIDYQFFISRAHCASLAQKRLCPTHPRQNSSITSWNWQPSSAEEGSNVAEADAFAYIAGFTIFNDWSCRDLQRDEMEARLGPAKGKDSATSLGPWIVTTDELAPYIRDGRVHVRCTLKVNGVQWMDNNGGLMYHTWGAMIERASRDSRIAPGDVLGGGTVTGGSIGEAIRNGFPARYLQPGDVVEIEVEGIGVLRNTLAPKVNPDPNYRFKAPPLASPAPAR